MTRRLPPYDYDFLHGMIGRNGVRNVLFAMADIAREIAATGMTEHWLATAAMLDEAAIQASPKHEARRKRKAA